MADPYSVPDAAREVIREFSSPPLCRVCDEPLELGSVDRDGAKWCHYVRGQPGKGWDQEREEHIDRSIRWNPKARADLVWKEQPLDAAEEKQ